MKNIRDTPVLTDTYAKVQDFRPQSNSTYLFGQTSEERSGHISTWETDAPTAVLNRIISEDRETFSTANTQNSYSLRSDSDLARFWSIEAPSEVVYLDITGLPHSIWAALLRSGLALSKELIVTYAEPSNYRRSAAPVEGQIYDLSASVSGISPLPGYAVLSERFDSDFILVALLGFEGARLSFMLEHVQPGTDRIIPVIGCPGFKPWYIFEAYVGNKRVLIDTQAWHEALYAPGNCPFSVFYLLDEISKTRSETAMKVALVGTKPHSLGAVLFALATENPVELIYDHPIRAEKRTDGTERLLAYHVSKLVSYDPAVKRAKQRYRSRGISR
ncbi:hypothetical protein SAMN05216350_108196 [Polaromonas sp. YR568]|uniref:hypothetical protein n=1 Tax=Polaromonas sp. YR568 TaxID=1855301 RepID=UPI0008DFDC46|nr:hypothetical protein [Polaromonas sp. YR568]SFU92926.1 hypothetical protein SAMN05216350_108196 [Polaromonas sp. YR568]